MPYYREDERLAQELDRARIAAEIDRDAETLQRRIADLESKAGEWTDEDITPAGAKEILRIGTMHEASTAQLKRIRRQVEEAVEQLRYTLSTLSVVDGHLHGEKGGDTEGEGVDVLDAEQLLAELDRIFGDRPAVKRSMPADDARWFEVPGRHGAKGLQVAINLDGATFLWPVDPEVGEGFALCGESARDLEMILRAFLPADVALASDPVAPPPSAEMLESLMALASLAASEPASERRERQAARFEDRDGKVEGVDR